MENILSQNTGYFILIGLGLAVALIVSAIIRAETKWLGIKHTVEWFSNAGGNIKTGLLTSSVVSAWVWAATLLQSSTVAYQYGIAGPFWYAAGATIPLLFFSILAFKVKKITNGEYTFTQIIDKRLGTSAHKVFVFFALMTNTIVTSMLVLGGAAAVHVLTGIEINIVCIILPIGIIIYTFIGGLRATFLADYVNVITLFLGLLVFVSLIYFANPQIGGISGMYDRLVDAAQHKPIEGNVFGSYMTLASIGALVFGIINIIGNFGTVFVDQSYWQRAIAAKMRAASHGFIIGGLVWFAIPFTLASTLGLAAVASGIQLSSEQISLGLVAPKAANFLLGDIGSIILLTMVFTAVTSAGSAQLIAASTLITHDVYKKYKNPSASSSTLFSTMRKTIVFLGPGMMLLGIILFQLGLSLQYVYCIMGILIGPAVGPISLALLWKKTNRNAAVLAAVVGIVIGISVWLGLSMVFGSLSIHTTSQNMPLLFGNIASLAIGFVITIVGSLIKPENFEWKHLEKSPEFLVKNKFEFKKIKTLAIFISAGLVVFWPLPLYFSGFVFTKIVFEIWIWLGIIWAVCASIIAICRPILESRVGIWKVLRGSIVPILFAGVIFVTISSYLFISSSDLKNRYIDVFIFLTMFVMIGFGLIVLVLNKKLRSLVKIQTEELVNERDHLEELVKEKTDSLLRHEKLAAIGEFSARISHDLRNPLSTILLNLKVLMSEEATTHHMEKYQRMLRASERINHQLDDVLNFLRNTPSKMELCSFPKIIELALERISIPPTIQIKKNITNVSIQCDELQIESMVTNLVLNGIQAVDEKGKISIRVVEYGKFIIIEVEDSGPEIPPNILSKMFEPLFTTKQRGTGLGLVSCKKIIDKHHGTIETSTCPTIFKVTLPKEQKPYNRELVNAKVKT